MHRSFALVLLVALACGGGETGKPATVAPSATTERYFKALDARFDGDSRAYYDELLELAHDEPDSRAGRKARAILQSDNTMWLLASAGSMASVAIPNFSRFQAKSKQSEAKSLLTLVYITEASYFAEKDRYCRSFKECGAELMAQQYVIVMSPKELQLPTTGVGPTAGEVRSALAAMSIKPHVDKKGFLVAAVANLDDDPDLDIWTVDQNNEMVHVSSDAE